MNVLLHEDISKRLRNLEKQGLSKYEQVLLSYAPKVQLLNQGGDFINFSSSDYLNLSKHPEFLNSIQDAIARYGYSTSSTRYISGTHETHYRLENALADFCGMESAMLFSSCYAANTGLITTLFNKDDILFFDEYNHASLIDGVQYSGAQFHAYKNNDVAELERLILKNARGAKRYKAVITNSIFSMDGTMANLNDLCSIAKRYDLLVIVDDSHGIGLFGDEGRGQINALNLTDKVDMITGTFGKALGAGTGGYVLGSSLILKYLKQSTHSYIYTNSVSPVHAHGCFTLLSLVRDNKPRKKLFDLCQYLQEALVMCGLSTIRCKHPIIPIYLNSAQAVVQLKQRLFQHGFLVTSMCYPDVPYNQPRLRLQLNAGHTYEDIEKLVDILKQNASAICQRKLPCV